ncbi:MAG TPA: hypothetical protein VHJ82_06980 [Actinomycetota bacterium]|nr:hypothetical protein [Actinomycetota bacterium]
MRRLAILLTMVLVLAVSLAPIASATHDASTHSDNIELVANYNPDLPPAEGEPDGQPDFRAGSDLAFWGNTAIMGNYGNPGGFRVIDISDPANPVQVGQFVCQGSQADVAIWGDLVFESVDSPRDTPDCPNAGANQAQILTGTAWEGVRVVSIENPETPSQIAAVYTDCGSHNNSVLPDLKNNRLLVYSMSYPVTNQGANCNYMTHRKVSVIEVPLDKPEEAKVIGTPSVEPSIGCHDVTFFPKLKLAGAACLTETQMWDISNPEEPEIIAHIPNQTGMSFSHSSTFTNDGRGLVVGDEMGGAIFAPGCLEDQTTTAAFWFYDVSDPENPVHKGHWKFPRQQASVLCTAHNFNVVPLRNDTDLLIAIGYQAGIAVLDFTDMENVTELGHYIARDEHAEASVWASYWYNGYIWANNFDSSYANALSDAAPGTSRGLDVFRFNDPIVKGAVKLKRLNPQLQEFLYRK